MKLTQVKGNTYVLEGWELIPLYRTDDRHCILLDTGLAAERRAIEAALTEARLTPIGILGSHIHTDHSPNHRYFQKKYGISLALPEGEAGLCCSLLNLKSYFFMLSPATAAEEVADMMVDAEICIGHEDGDTLFLGETFRVVHTPGHSPDHITVITPDDVCYVGDALLSGDDLNSKLPYSFAQQAALDSMEKLRELDCVRYIAAHRGVYDTIGELIDQNRAMILDRAQQIRALIDRPMTLDQIYHAACAHFKLLTERPQKAALFERNLRSFVEFLLDRGELTLTARGGVRYYRSA